MSMATSEWPEVTAEYIAGAVGQVAETYEEKYYDPEAAAEMAARLRARLEEGAFAEIDSVPRLANLLMSELRTVRKDKHIAVIARPASKAAAPTHECGLYEAYASDNYGFRKLEILPGTIGYAHIRIFCPVALAGDTAVAAMNFLANANALIFDLRGHLGGEDNLIRLITGYLFEETVELCSIHHRGARGLQQSWTADYVPGPRLADVPVYILTDYRTFSGGEDFTYNLQQRGRALVVGERTGGGGHTVESIKYPEHYLELIVPEGEAINPISGAGWEGTGVTPDIEVPPEQALAVAYRHALQRLSETLDNEAALHRVNWALAKANADVEPVTLAEDVLAAYVGQYGQANSVRLEDGALVVSHRGYPDASCTPLAEDLFEYDGGAARVRFVREGNQVTKAIFLLEEGHEFPVKRSE